MVSPLKLDPSRTFTLRRSAIADMRRRLAKFKKKLQQLIVTDNVFGLSVHEDWQDLSPEKQAEEFKKWIIEALALTLLFTADGVSWTFEYLKKAHDKGVRRTYDELDLIPSDVTIWYVEDMEALNDFLKSATSKKTLEDLRLHLDTAIEVIAAALISILVLKFIEGRSGSLTELYSELLRALETSETSFIRLLRTEIVRAQAEGQLDIYEKANVEGLKIMVEWRIGAGNVCPRCQANAGHIFTLEEARGLIPLHMNCQCSWSIV